MYNMTCYIGEQMLTMDGALWQPIRKSCVNAWWITDGDA